jgi:membrane protein
VLARQRRAPNAIWGVTKQRPWIRRVPTTWRGGDRAAPPRRRSLAASLQSQWPVQRLLERPWFALLYDLGLRQASTVFVIAGLAFLYWFLPNTEVSARAALLGGAVGGVLFSVAQKLYVGLSVGAAHYDAIFGGFIAPIADGPGVCVGAIAAARRRGRLRLADAALYWREVRGAPAAGCARDHRSRGRAGHRGQQEAHPWDEETLSEHLEVPLRTVRDVVAKLEKAALVAPVADATRQGVWQLARPAQRIRVSDVLGALRGPREAPLRPRQLAAAVEAVFAEVDAQERAVAGRSLAELLENERASAGTGRAPAVDPAGASD